MALFLIHHQHAADRCPFAAPDLGTTLLNHLSPPSVRQHGVEIRGEAVVDGEHRLDLIVESSDEEHVREFMKPFALVGGVDILPASTCVSVVARGGCAAPAPDLDDVVPALDPQEACERAMRAGLVVHRAHPLNCETSIPALIGGLVMPNAHFYVRNHFQIPMLDPASWRLHVGGLVERPLSLTLADLIRMRSESLAVTLECAGNARSLLNPPAEGEQWRLGAVSTAEWTGVPLAEVLDRAGLKAGAREVVLRGADRGTLPGGGDRAPFERSLELDDVRHSEALLAYAMNGEPLPVQHGFPLRVIVPSWYAVASVKWLTEIEVTDGGFDGFFQTSRYVYEWERDGRPVREPVTLTRVRSLVTEPKPDEAVECGDLAIRGVAWSGAGPISRVEVSVGDGPWQQARLIGERHRHSWQWWELITHVGRPGTTTLRSRATDMAGRTQPDDPEWNRLGYGNNAIHGVGVRVQ